MRNNFECPNLSLLDLNDPRDFTDSMLIEISKTTDKSSSFYGESGIENLRNTLLDLFLGGSETTSSTLTWASLYMVRYPHIQKKVQEELDQVVGRNRPPSIKDKPNLPYTEVSVYQCLQGRIPFIPGCVAGDPEILQPCSNRFTSCF